MGSKARVTGSDIMSDARYAEVKAMLEVRRHELQRNLGVKLRNLGANNGHDRALVGPLDAAEASDSDLQQDIAVTLNAMAAEVLGRVDEARARLASGAYGSCVECDGEISLKRLTVLPLRSDVASVRRCTRSAKAALANFRRDTAIHYRSSTRMVETSDTYSDRRVTRIARDQFAIRPPDPMHAN